MLWDKSNYEKKKESELKLLEAERNTLGAKVSNFLLGQARGRIEWPNTDLFIGVGFEYGGAHESYGFGIFLRQPDGTLKLFAEGRDLGTALETATAKFRKELENENN